MAAVWGKMAARGGHAPLTESMAVMGIPVMMKKTFIDAEKQIDQWWWTLLEDSMKEAGAAEKAIADNIMVQISNHRDCRWGVVEMLSQTQLQC